MALYIYYCLHFYFTDIVTRLALSSSESELDEKHDPANLLLNFPLIEHDLEIEFNEHLLAFQNTMPRYMKNKKTRRQKKKEKKDDGKFYSFRGQLTVEN